MALSPLACTDEVRESYINYLLAALPLRDPELRQQYEHLLREPGRMLKGPILEATPAFRPGATLEDLVGEGLLDRRFRGLGSFPSDRKLHVHQEQAIRRAAGGARNLVIATGTGSGKTECFLLPILQGLFEELQRGTLTPGVRALLLYPMNALANDQLRRLRVLLSQIPEITFGRYTGETKETTSEAEKHFRLNFPNEPRVRNELLSREQIRAQPPHLLLTNHAMLEYLLLRPKDSELFEGQHSGHWRFLVVDEAHTFNGAVGIETAYLLRRLKHRVLRPGQRLQCFATSATLGGGRGDFPQVVDFATKLFGEPFEWVESDCKRQDVVEAERLPADSLGESWGAPAPALYAELLSAVESQGSADAIGGLLHRHGVPESLCGSVVGAWSDPDLALYHLLKGDRHLHLVRRELDKGPRYLDELSGILGDGPESLVALVNLAARARPHPEVQSLFPARYHLFVRALEGAFLRLAPEPALFLDRRLKDSTPQGEMAVFEVATCRGCGQHFLVGAGDGQILSGDRTDPSEFDDPVPERYFMVVSDPSAHAVQDDDEDVACQIVKPDDPRLYRLCVRCGHYHPADSLDLGCACEESQQVYLLQARTPKGQASWCPACGQRLPGGITRFGTGKDATASVLATALYRTLPDLQAADGEADEEDEYVPRAEKAPRSSRKLLVFSDSRQDAAFFACYLDRTYSQITRRALLLACLRKLWGAGERDIRVSVLARSVRAQSEHLKLFPSEVADQDRQLEVLHGICGELLALDRRHGLEATGLLRVDPVPPEGFKCPPGLAREPFSLTDGQAWTLMVLLLDSLRIQGAMTLPEPVHPDDDFFAPRNRRVRVRQEVGDPKKGVFPWCPSAGRSNRRLDILIRLLLKRGCSASEADRLGREALAGLWRFFTKAELWEPYFESAQDEAGVSFRLKQQLWQFVPVQPGDLWVCLKCGRLTSRNLADLCPAYECAGELAPAREENLLGDHYRRLYQEVEPIPMSVEEHTAQLRSDYAAQLQDRFTRGEVNVLSCSTTFELGVDVGELEAVLLRNVPPETSNYVQRAGRAGRRASGTALVLTYAQRRSHDLTYFMDPLRMVRGQVQPPRFTILNEKIARRHLHAIAISAFLRQAPDYFPKLQDLFPQEQREAGADALDRWLGCRPAEVLGAADAMFPEMREDLELPWGWVQRFVGEGGIMRLAQDRYIEDLEEMERLRQQLFQAGKPSDWIGRAVRNLQNREVIDYLCARGVLPKYGFPVDVVPLELQQDAVEAGRLELDRDLRLALSEFAPGGQVVAGGRIWTSYGIKLPPKRDEGLSPYHYAVCGKCGRYQRQLDDAKLASGCQSCGEALDKPRKLLFPRLGFVTARHQVAGRPGDRRPDRTHTSSLHFANYDEEMARRLGRTLRREVIVPIGESSVRINSSRFGLLAVVNQGRRGAGFQICEWCGFGRSRVDGTKDRTHKKPSGADCGGPLKNYHLGHEFMTDVVQLDFPLAGGGDVEFWRSLLYALLEGASIALSVRRQDLDGCLYSEHGDGRRQAVILLDNVPGGAGHVSQVPGRLGDVLVATLQRVGGDCGCGSETSCYGCLRNYANQRVHGRLARGPVKEYLEGLLGQG